MGNRSAGATFSRRHFERLPERRDVRLNSDRWGETYFGLRVSSLTANAITQYSFPDNPYIRFIPTRRQQLLRATKNMDVHVEADKFNLPDDPFLLPGDSRKKRNRAALKKKEKKKDSASMYTGREKRESEGKIQLAQSRRRKRACRR